MVKVVGVGLIALGAMGLLSASRSSADGDEQSPRVTSRVESIAEGEVMLVHEVRVLRPLDDVWPMFSTAEGYSQWAVPKAKFDWKPGGSIQLQYDPTKDVGDPGTNELTIINFVPRKLITLRAKPSMSWPEFMRADSDRMTNAIIFQSMSPNETLVTCYGIGYRDSEEYKPLLAFFEQGNKGLLEKLVKLLDAKNED